MRMPNPKRRSLSRKITASISESEQSSRTLRIVGSRHASDFAGPTRTRLCDPPHLRQSERHMSSDLERTSSVSRVVMPPFSTTISPWHMTVLTFRLLPE